MKHYALFFLLLTAGFLAGCQKEADQIDCAVLSTSPIIPVSYQAPVQIFKINTTQQMQFTTLQGSRIAFYGGNFQFPDGQPLPGNAELQLEVREMVTKADMILNTTPTISNGSPIESAGEYHLRVTYNGRQVSLRPRARLFISTPPSTVPLVNDMQVFLGATTNNTLNWLPAADSLSRAYPQSNGIYTMIVANDSLGWINCDRFLGLSPLTRVSIAVPAPDVSPANTVAYFVFRNRKAVMSAVFNATTSTFSANNMPEKEPLTAVVIRYANDKFYFGRQDLILGTNQVFTPALQEISEANLVAEIKRL